MSDLGAFARRFSRSATAPGDSRRGQHRRDALRANASRGPALIGGNAMTRTRRLVSALAALLLTLGVSSAARADTRSSPVLAAITLPGGSAALDEVTVGTAVWTLSVDGNHGYLFRIDPVLNASPPRSICPSGIADRRCVLSGRARVRVRLTVGTETYRDQVWRIDPASARVQARIATDRYPTLLTAGGGSVWVSQGEDGSVARIDPGTDVVVATIPVGRQAGGKDQPFGINFDPYTERGAGRPPRDAPDREHRRDDAGGEHVLGCAGVRLRARRSAARRVLARRLTVLQRGVPLGQRTHQVVAHFTLDPPDGGMYGIAVRNNVLYSGEGVCGTTSCYGVVVKRDLRTGAVIKRVRTPSFLAFLPDLAGGDLWVAGYFDGVLVHLRAF